VAREQTPPEETSEEAAAVSSGDGAGRPAASLTPEQRQRLATAVRRETAPTGGGREHADLMVYVWPHLVAIEFLASMLMLVSLTVMSMVVNAPLEGHANADKTPNPSKAPWYFLNLQELLLHMHPALAGVIVPAGALALIAMIPYIDRDTRDVGRWFGTPKAKPIAIFTMIFTAIVLTLEIFFDEFIGVKPMMEGLAAITGVKYFSDPNPVVFGVPLGVLSPPNVIVPMILLNGPIAVLLVLIYWIYRPITLRELMICLFTGFFVSYVVLTISGTFFRGQGMHLFWPWDPHQIRLE